MNVSILRSVTIVSGIAALQLVTQFALQVVIAERFGATSVIDAFNAALTIPTTLNTILTVSLSYVLIPTLTLSLASNRHDPDAWKLATATGTWLVAISTLLCLLLSLGSDQAITLLCPGFDPETHRLASQCLAILAWQLELGVIVAWLTSIENASMGFAWPSFTAFLGAALNLVLAYAWLSYGILGYAWSIMVSGLIQVILLAIPLRASLASWALHHPKLKTMLLQWLPLLLGGAYVRIDPIVDRFLGSQLEEGSIAHLGYATRFIQALLSIASGGLLTVLFPKLSKVDASDPGTELSHRIKMGLHAFLLIVTPIVMGGLLFAAPVVHDLLERGSFTAVDTREVARLFQILLWMFAGATIADLFARGHYTLGQYWRPTCVTVICISLAYVFKFLTTKTWGIDGIAWATSGYFVVVTAVLAITLHRAVGCYVDLRLMATWLRSLAVTALACGIAWFIDSRIDPYGTFVAAPIAAITYLGIQYPYVQQLRKGKGSGNTSPSP